MTDPGTGPEIEPTTGHRAGPLHGPLRGLVFSYRVWLLLAALICVLVALARPSLPGSVSVHRYFFVVDISGSMYVRDYLHEGQTITRMQQVQQALSETVQALPCGSMVSLGLFSAWQTAVLFEPLEVCRHRVELERSIREMHWRMAWIPQSNIMRGLNDALSHRRRMAGDPALVFVSDFDEAPVLGRPTWVAQGVQAIPGRGLLLGAGRPDASPVPRLDGNDREIGFRTDGQGGIAYSRLDMEHMELLAPDVNMDTHVLTDTAGLTSLLTGNRYLQSEPGRHNLSPWFAALALALLLLVYLLDWLPGKRMRLFGRPSRPD